MATGPGPLRQVKPVCGEIQPRRTRQPSALRRSDRANWIEVRIDRIRSIEVPRAVHAWTHAAPCAAMDASDETDASDMSSPNVTPGPFLSRGVAFRADIPGARASPQARGVAFPSRWAAGRYTARSFYSNRRVTSVVSASRYRTDFRVSTDIGFLSARVHHRQCGIAFAKIRPRCLVCRPQS